MLIWMDFQLDISTAVLILRFTPDDKKNNRMLVH